MDSPVKYSSRYLDNSILPTFPMAYNQIIYYKIEDIILEDIA